MGISKEIVDFVEETESSLKKRFEKIDNVSEYWQLRIVDAMRKNKVSEACFNQSSGYGYNDLGRDTLEKVYADVFRTKSALVRPQITCGTHALAITLQALLRPGDRLLSPAGKPYDTLEEVIGKRPSKGSLAEFGIGYDEIPLKEDGNFDYDNILKAVTDKTKVATIQKSKGYQLRQSFGNDKIGELIAVLKREKPDIICMVDNCYGEFVEINEPSEVGADVVVGSLIKNPGGGLAPCGGYIVGKEDLIEACGVRLCAPGLSREVGPSLGLIQSFYQGLFMAPVVVGSALKGAILAANLYEKMGYFVIPDGKEERKDIIQAVHLGSAEKVIAFCKAIQGAAPVDSHLMPQPWAMPGYDCDVIMAAGAFVQGSSIELSADAPIKEPYAVYFQGGLTYPHAKFGIMNTLSALSSLN
ncbi:MAG: methionine gamma-lyase family protein [Lachnospiraceae bacterium]|nr:methionine gamma-lyase family protein [Lachnospiraceae bacterium]